jgi:hypothetical protein
VVDGHPLIVGGYVLAGMGTLGLLMFLLGAMNRSARLDASGADVEQDPAVLRILKEMQERLPGS